MSNVVLRTGVLVLACLVAVEFRVKAAEKKAEELNLRSEYSDAPLLKGGREVGLAVTLNEKGGGSGILTLDPNIQREDKNGIISKTLLPDAVISVQLKLIQDKAETAKGRRLYELREVENGKVDTGRVRWYLAVPLKEGAPCWLMSADENGKFQDIVMLRHR
jgi:hypothetical protein